MNLILSIVLAAAALGAGVGLGYFIRKNLGARQVDSAEAKANQIILDAKTKQKEILLKTKEEALKLTDAAKREEQERRNQLNQNEQRLSRREENLDHRFEQIDHKQQELSQKVSHVHQIKQELGQIREKQMATLEKVAALPKEKAKSILLEMTEKDMKEKLLQRIKKMENYEQTEVNRKAKEILALAIQRTAGAYSAESTATTVELPSDDMKGRIIGREGRNIKSLEEKTGVEIIVDDTPNAIVVSGFSPVRRQIAKVALEKLIADGRIHPTRIEESIAQAKKEVGANIREAGEAAVYDVGVAGLDPKLIHLLGRLKYRSSYGQNVLRHSIEVAHIGAILAEELNGDVALVKKAGLLHDIGKAVDHEIQGTHIEIGRDILKKFKQPQEVITAMESHHEDVEPGSLEAIIVTAADAISAARPGARKDTYEDYIKRLEDLEDIAGAFEGVEKTFAIQAGREVRVFVEPVKIDDLKAKKLAKEIADKIESELKYPGEIKVNVIRETRVEEYAR